jgi:hypothetical protein
MQEAGQAEAGKERGAGQVMPGSSQIVIAAFRGRAPRAYSPEAARGWSRCAFSSSVMSAPVL